MMLKTKMMMRMKNCKPEAAVPMGAGLAAEPTFPNFSYFFYMLHIPKCLHMRKAVAPVFP